ncbi:MAG: hypothetical protein NZM04_07730 [Methylacidiphilales bacterium]|nr:hypothetical protein [Candidatus Methylacidiphilales bacterium]MDW8349589.1 hypothetical protein [Verrucomicrobiae bacterium]
MSALSPFIDWQIQPRSRRCALTHNPFQEGEIVYSILARASAKENWHRLDYSAQAWSQRPSNLEILCQWQSRYKLPQEPKPAPSSTNGDPEALARSLLLSKDPNDYPLCTLLALMLERKRKLKFLSRQQDEKGSWLLYEHVASGETWLIPEVIPQESDYPKLEMEIRKRLSVSQPGTSTSTG